MAERREISILVLGGSTHENRGDLAMQEGIVWSLQQHLPEARILFYAFNPQETEAVLRVKAELSPALTLSTAWNRDTPRSTWQRLRAIGRGTAFWAQVMVHRWTGLMLTGQESRRKFLQELSSAAAVIVPGSGAMNSYWWHDWFYPQAFCVVAARLRGVPVILTSQGIGPVFAHALDRWVARRMFRNASLLGVRDAEQSFRILKDLGALHERCVHSGDDAILMPMQASAAVQAFAHEGLIAVNFRDSSTYQKGFPKPALPNFARALEIILQQDDHARLLFVPISYNAQDDDRKPARGVCGLLEEKHQPRVSVMEDEMHAQELRALIASARCGMGISYHFLLFCLSSNVPALGLFANAYYEQKTCGLFQLYGMEEWLVDIRQGVDAESLAEKFARLHATHGEITTQLRQRNAELRAREEAFRNQMIGLISAEDRSRQSGC